MLLLATTETGRAGFKLHYLNRNGLTGSSGILRCTRLATRILSPRIALPMRDISPIFFEQDKSIYSWQLALMLQPPPWIDLAIAVWLDAKSKRSGSTKTTFAFASSIKLCLHPFRPVNFSQIYFFSGRHLAISSGNVSI